MIPFWGGVQRIQTYDVFKGPYVADSKPFCRDPGLHALRHIAKVVICIGAFLSLKSSPRRLYWELVVCHDYDIQSIEHEDKETYIVKK